MSEQRQFWTDTQRAALTERFANMQTQTLADEIGRTYKSVVNQARKMGLKKSPEFLAGIQSGRIGKLMAKGEAFRFQKGFTPANKGKKMSAAVYEKAKPTMFKKGAVPPNTQFDGHERISKDGYLEVRVRQGKYRPKHHLIYEESIGPIPSGMIVVFRDKNPKNLDSDNLEAITRKENMERNTIQRYPPKLKFTMRLVSRLNKLIHEKQN